LLFGLRDNHAVAAHPKAPLDNVNGYCFDIAASGFYMLQALNLAPVQVFFLY